jgi:hypothetical protein
MFEQFSKESGKEQYLIPYFIDAHPGTTDTDMLDLALWLKQNGFRADQVQNFYPSPMATATAMYHSGKNPLRKVGYKSESVAIVKQPEQRRLHKAFLRYHDPQNWAMLRDALKTLGRTDLIGDGEHQLIPTWQADELERTYKAPRRKNSAQAHNKRKAPGKGSMLSQHTGLPPRDDGARPAGRRKKS